MNVWIGTSGYSYPDWVGDFYPRGTRSNWYAGDKERYDYAYDDSELNEWVELMNAAQERTEEILFLFNNCYRGQAVSNALRLRELIEQGAPQLSVVPSFAERPPQQRSLFDS